MSQEIRYIVFDEVDIAAALIGWVRRQGGRVDAGPCAAVMLRRAGAETEAALRADGTDAPPRVALRGSELTAALIHFCGRRGIPLPRRAAKRLVLHDGRLVLMMTRNAEPAEPQVADGAVCYDGPLVRSLAPRAPA